MATDTVKWKNNNWREGVTIEIRRGSNPIATNNPVIATPTISNGETHTENSDGDDFFYVRTHPAGDGVYVHRPCYGTGATYTENL